MGRQAEVTPSLLLHRVCRLYVTDLVRLFQYLYNVPFGNQFLPDIAHVVRRGNRPHDSRIVEFLCLVQFITSRISRRMKMPDIVNVLPEGADDIAFYLCYPYSRSPYSLKATARAASIQCL